MKLKKLFHLNLSMQSNGFLKFELQNYINNETNGKGQKLNCDCIV